MTSRQAGHFSSSPRGYDEVNHATHEHKEQIKVGYNLKRKVVLMAHLGAVAARALAGSHPVRPVPGILQRRLRAARRAGLARRRLGGLLFRTVHLFFIKDVQTGLVWATKIITDPFHDIKLYYKRRCTCFAGS